MDAPSLLSSIIAGASSRAAAYAVRDGGLLLPDSVAERREVSVCAYLAFKAVYVHPSSEEEAEAIMAVMFPDAEVVAVTIEVVL